MSGFPILDLVAGLIFIYFLLSIICSSAVEIIMTVGKIRAKVLASWLTSIFDIPLPATSGGQTKTLGEAIIDHCSVTALSKTGKSNSYLDARNFTIALLEKVLDHSGASFTSPITLQSYITAIQGSTILPGELKRVLLMYAYEAQASIAKTESDIETFKNKIENWYDSSMDRVTGALKTKYSRPFTFLLATILVIALNADSISITKYLYNNPEARMKLAAQAYSAPKDSAFQHQVNKLKIAKGLKGLDSATLKQVTDSINVQLRSIRNAKAALDAALPLGWQKEDVQKLRDFSGVWILTKLAGLVATMLAIMMGAPFWFDVLNKIANLRGTGKKPDASGT